MAKREQKGKGGKSFVISAIDYVTAFIYSLFSSGRAGKALVASDDALKPSFFDPSRKMIRSNPMDSIISQSRILRLFGSFKDVLASLALNVYGIFFVVYGLMSITMYYTAFIVNGMVSGERSALLLSVICTVCAIPMLVTSKSVATVISESKITKSIVTSFLAIPEEKLRSDKHIFGTEYMFMSAIIAVLMGVVTYFIHPSYALYLVATILVVSVVSTNPETGVVLTVFAAPFLQYLEYSRLILIFLILLTGVSYIVKVARHRRAFDFSAESALVLIFCGFILVAGSFTPGGWNTFLNSLYAVAIILGGFYLPYNLIRSQKRLFSCVRILVTSLVIISCFGLWDVFYNGMAEGVIYSLSESIRPIFEINIIYIADSAAVFGVFAVLTVPLLFVSTTRQRSISSFLAVIILLVIVFAAVFIYGSYEAVIAIIIEVCIFLLLYSHRSVTVALIVAIPVLSAVILYPYLAQNFGWPNLGSIIRNMFPLGFESAPAQSGGTESVIEMLKDGNWMGIGVGQDAFTLAIKSYENAVSVGATDPASLWLQIICWSGVGGLVVFLIFAVVMIVKSLGYVIISREKRLRGETVALICCFFTAMLFGFVNCIWNDVRMLYLFWVCAGILAGFVRTGRETENKKAALFADSFDNTDIELRFN